MVTQFSLPLIVFVAPLATALQMRVLRITRFMEHKKASHWQNWEEHGDGQNTWINAFSSGVIMRTGNVAREERSTHPACREMKNQWLQSTLHYETFELPEIPATLTNIQ